MARIPEFELERLKAEVSLVRLVEARGITLVRQGRDWVARCPFHADATPTWMPVGNGGYWQKVMTDANGRSSVDEVDAHGRLLAHQDLGGRRYVYQYNHAGLLTRNGTTSYEYYNNGLLKYLRSSEQGTVGYYE